MPRFQFSLRNLFLATTMVAVEVAWSTRLWNIDDMPTWELVFWPAAALVVTGMAIRQLPNEFPSARVLWVMALLLVIFIVTNMAMSFSHHGKR